MSPMSEVPDEFEQEIPEDRAAATSFYGRACAKCHVPIHYSYASEIEGYCGKCTDIVRKRILDSHRSNMERDLIGAKLPEEPSGGGLRLILGLLLGLILASAGSIALAEYKPDLWGKIIQAVEGVLGRDGPK